MKALDWLLGRTPRPPRTLTGSVSPEDTVYVVAGNYAQFAEFCRRNASGGVAALNVAGASDLLGLDAPRVVLVGTYADRPDLLDIDLACRSCRAVLLHDDLSR